MRSCDPAAAEVTRRGIARGAVKPPRYLVGYMAFLLCASLVFAGSTDAEHQAAIKAIDAAVQRFETDLGRVSDPGQRARIELALEGFKERRDALRQKFDPVRYDELRFELNVEYQRLGMFLAPPATKRTANQPPPLSKHEIADLGLTLVPIGPGTFMMGRKEDAPGAAADESPETRIVFSKVYWLGTTEVTIGQWRRFLEATGQRSAAKNGGSRTDRHPIVGVSWSEAFRFCQWLTDRERKAGHLPADYAFSLPTEAQWEHACRAGNHGPDAEKLDEWAWHAGNSGGGPRPVATRRPNLWGLYDMQGNVAEWCADSLGKYPGGTLTDPRGGAEGRVQVRGGSASSPAAGGIGSTRRMSVPVDQRRDDVGFRVALTAVP